MTSGVEIAGTGAKRSATPRSGSAPTGPCLLMSSFISLPLPFPENPVMRTNSGTKPGLIIAVALALATPPGCGTVKTSGTSRTATEQLLLTNAWNPPETRSNSGRSAACRSISTRPTCPPSIKAGSSPASTRRCWNKACCSGRRPTRRNGSSNRVSACTAPTNRTGCWAWQGQLPADRHRHAVGDGAGNAPHRRNKTRKAWRSSALFAYDRSSGRLVWQSGTMMSVATAKDVTVFGVGPIRSGTIRDGTDLAGIKIPLSADGLPLPPPPTGLGRLRAQQQMPIFPAPHGFRPQASAEFAGYWKKGSRRSRDARGRLESPLQDSTDERRSTSTGAPPT